MIFIITLFKTMLLISKQKIVLLEKYVSENVTFKMLLHPTLMFKLFYITYIYVQFKPSVSVVFNC